MYTALKYDQLGVFSSIRLEVVCLRTFVPLFFVIVILTIPRFIALTSFGDFGQGKGCFVERMVAAFTWYKAVRNRQPNGQEIDSNKGAQHVQISELRQKIQCSSASY